MTDGTDLPGCPDPDHLARLVLKMEADAHRAGWDVQPGLYALHDHTHEPTAAMIRQLGTADRHREGPYTAWQILSDELVGNPTHDLYRLAVNLTVDHPTVHQLVAILGGPAFVGIAFRTEGWMCTGGPDDKRPDRPLADIPGSVEIRTVYAVDAADRQYYVLRRRGERPQLLNPEWSFGGTVPDYLRAIVAGILGRPTPPEELPLPRDWRWEDQAFAASAGGDE